MVIEVDVGIGGNRILFVFIGMNSPSAALVIKQKPADLSYIVSYPDIGDGCFFFPMLQGTYKFPHEFSSCASKEEIGITWEADNLT